MTPSGFRAGARALGPVRPLTGPGDWLERIRWANGRPDRDLRRWLGAATGNGWSGVLR
ncbi:MAG: hypothetical protein HY701_11275 [Gemmatimonadetes bacterium]|nr:hypothetical protein [Gemmatimonadota bacterium]